MSDRPLPAGRKFTFAHEIVTKNQRAVLRACRRWRTGSRRRTFAVVDRRPVGGTENHLVEQHFTSGRHETFLRVRVIEQPETSVRIGDYASVTGTAPRFVARQDRIGRTFLPWTKHLL